MTATTRMGSTSEIRDRAGTSPQADTGTSRPMGRGPARQAVSVAGYVLITLEPNGYNNSQSEAFSNIYKGIHNWSSQPDLNYTTMYDRLIRSEDKAG